MTIQEAIERKTKEREILKNCCVQKWATKKEKEHWYKGINAYDLEIMQLEELAKQQSESLAPQPK